MHNVKIWLFASIALNLLLAGVIMNTCQQRTTQKKHEFFLKHRLSKQTFNDYMKHIKQGRIQQDAVHQQQIREHRKLMDILAAKTFEPAVFLKQAKIVSDLRSQSTMVIYQVFTDAVKGLSQEQRSMIREGIEEYRQYKQQ